MCGEVGGGVREVKVGLGRIGGKFSISILPSGLQGFLITRFNRRAALSRGLGGLAALHRVNRGAQWCRRWD